MKYRYLDLRRAAVRKNLELRHRMTSLIRNFLDNLNFIGGGDAYLDRARRPRVLATSWCPSRMNPGQFYALPQKSADAETVADGFGL